MLHKKIHFLREKCGTSRYDVMQVHMVPPQREIMGPSRSSGETIKTCFDVVHY